MNQKNNANISKLILYLTINLLANHMELGTYLFNSEEENIENKRNNKTNFTKFPIKSNNTMFFNENFSNSVHNENTQFNENKETPNEEFDETDVFIQNLLKQEESLIKLQIKLKLEEVKNSQLIKELEKSKKYNNLIN